MSKKALSLEEQLKKKQELLPTFIGMMDSSQKGEATGAFIQAAKAMAEINDLQKQITGEDIPLNFRSLYEKAMNAPGVDMAEIERLKNENEQLFEANKIFAEAEELYKKRIDALTGKAGRTERKAEEKRIKEEKKKAAREAKEAANASSKTSFHFNIPSMGEKTKQRLAGGSVIAGVAHIASAGHVLPMLAYGVTWGGIALGNLAVCLIGGAVCGAAGALSPRLAGSVIASIYNLGAKPSRTFEPFKEWVVDPIVKFKNTKKSAKEDSDFFSKERGLIGSIDNVAMLCGGVVGTVLVGLPAGVAFLQVISGEDLKKGGSPTLGYTGRAASAVYDKVRDWTWNTPAHAVGSLFGVNEEDALTAPKNLPKDTIHWHDAVKTMKPSKSAVHKP